jgi:oligopeptidase B
MEPETKSALTSYSPEHHGGGTAGDLRPPVAQREPVEHVIHGDRRMDHYAWLRKKDDPRVKGYLQEENAYSQAFMKSTEAFQEQLYQEMLGRILQTDLSVPYRLRGYSYFTRTEEGRQYPIYCRRAESSQFTVDKSPFRRGEEDERSLEGLPPEDAGHEKRDSLSLKQEFMSDLKVPPPKELEYPGAPGTAAGEKGAVEENLERAGRKAGATWKREERNSGEAGEEVLLDLNVLAEGHSFLGLGMFAVSDDNRLLAYGTDTTGFRQYRLEVKDLGTRALLHFQVERVTSVAWSSDSRTLFYVVEDEVTKRSWQLWKHEFEERPVEQETKNPREGGAIQGDKLIYEEKDERFRIDIERTRSGAYLLLVSNSHTTSEIRYLRADQPFGEFRRIAAREDDHEYYVDHHPGSALNSAGGIFFIRTNSGGRTYRLMTAPTANPGRECWKEVVAHRPGVMLAGMESFRKHVVLLEREGGLPYLRIVDLTKAATSALEASYRIEFAEPAYNATLGANPEFDTGHVRFQYESFLTPRSVYDYDLKSGERILRKQQPVLGGYDASEYGSERIHALAKDGARVPLSVVFRHDTPRDGSAPLLLYGYGSYGLSMPVTFSSNRLSLLNRGVIFALAHVRGGGELGKPWHDAGRMRRKMNTFTDFIAAAEYLIDLNYTSKKRLIIEGGSAGGLLMGAVTNLRPDLFSIAISHVPFVDVLNTMLDASLPLTVGEYEEWGNPQKEEDYFYIKGYCPYTNLERKDYPAMLVKTGLNDSQVMYWEPAKYVAKLRTLKTDGNTLLLKTNLGAGHGGASGRYDYLKEIAFDYAFLLKELGMQETNRSQEGTSTSSP